MVMLTTIYLLCTFLWILLSLLPEEKKGSIKNNDCKEKIPSKQKPKYKRRAPTYVHAQYTYPRHLLTKDTVFITVRSLLGRGQTRKEAAKQDWAECPKRLLHGPMYMYDSITTALQPDLHVVSWASIFLRKND